MKTSLNHGYTIGIGLTNRCNAACAHCYSRPTGEYQDLDFNSVDALLSTISVKSVNFGTGESILSPHFQSLVDRLSRRGIPMGLTSNGYTVACLSDQELKQFHDVDFSLDFPDPDINDRWRGQGSFDSVTKGAQRCRDLGVEASIVTCLMKPNYNHMGKLARLAGDLGLNLRVNVYKPVFDPDLCPTYEQFWEAISELSEAAFFIACSEPIVKAALNYRNGQEGSPCGKQSFRIHPDGTVVSCVYQKQGKIQLQDLIKDFANHCDRLQQHLNLQLPDICHDCQHLSICDGGCAGRRLLTDPQAPDLYCFMTRGEFPQLQARWKTKKDLIHEDYLCTMIFSL